MNERFGRASRLAGPLAVVASFGGIAAAVALAPWFDFTHALSDLGRAGRASRFAFNGGLVLGGLLGLSYVPTCRRLAGTWPQRIATVIFAVSVAAMAGVGLFPTPHPLHFPAAVTLYLGITALLALWGLGEYLAGRRRMGTLLAAGAPVHVLAWLLWGAFAPGTPVSGLALPELVGAALFAGWVGVTARRAQ